MDAHLNTNHHSPFRHPNIVMAPERLGAMHQSRISFVRSIIRRMVDQEWQVSLHSWELSPQGFGHASYQLKTPHHIYHLVVFTDAIADEERNDRVIAEKWDVTFALVMGNIDNKLFQQLRNNVPLQEAGRNTSQVLVLARANKSVRVFNHLIESLANGQQPNAQLLASVGYILRTTAVYGNGKFGIADFELLKNNPDFNQSFSAQMCAVYLLRQFSLDWVHYLAHQQNTHQASYLDVELQRYLGVGNATGLGMAPFLINHPCIVDQWLTEREKAIATVASCYATDDKSLVLINLLERANKHLQQIVTINNQQQALNTQSTQEIPEVINHVAFIRQNNQQWHQLIQFSRQYNYETQEIIIACLLELYPELIDHHEQQMNADEALSLTPGITLSDLINCLNNHYRWALDIDFSQPENNYWFWYRSEDKEEPRMGVRGKEPGENQELSLDIARQVYQLNNVLAKQPLSQSLAEFLLKYPQYRTITRRVWTMSQQPLGDIQINVLSKDALPMHLLRCKLAMFGATKFDPRSDRWVRVTLFQGAPLLHEIHKGEWLFPLLPTLTNQPDEPTPPANSSEGLLQ